MKHKKSCLVFSGHFFGGGDLLLQFQEFFFEDRWYQVSTCYSIPRSTHQEDQPDAKSPRKKPPFGKIFFVFGSEAGNKNEKTAKVTGVFRSNSQGLGR